jgi:prolyl oligopeptidase
MSVSRGAVAAFFALVSVAAAAAAPATSAKEAAPAVAKQPIAAIKPVTDTRFGDAVSDNYRWMESGGADFDRYLKQQSVYTRDVLDRLPSHALFAARVAALSKANANVRLVSRFGDRYWFLRTPVGGIDASLASRAVDGGDVRVIATPQAFAQKNAHASIDFYAPSYDGSRVVLVVAHGGGEDWSLRIADGEGKLLSDEIVDIAEPSIAWAQDNRAIYYPRLQKLPKGAAEAARLENIRVYRHVLGTAQSADTVLFDPQTDAGLHGNSSTFPSLDETRSGRFRVAGVGIGTEPFKSYWLMDMRAPKPTWRKVADAADRVVLIAEHDGRFYALNQRTSAGQVIAFDGINGTAKDAQVLIDEPTFVVSTEGGGIALAQDGLYVSGLRDGHCEVRRLGYDASAPRRVLHLPANGTLIDFSADERAPGLVLSLQSSAVSPTIYAYDPATDRFADTGLMPRDPADFSNIETREAKVPSTDGAFVPITITLRKDLKLDGTHPTLMTAYGAYGAIVPQWFSAANLAWYERGGILVHVAARGGGELGEDWHSAALTVHKQRTVDDVIAAARWLATNGYTRADKLAVAGKSAGGIPAAGAIVQHSELFGAALIRVGVTDLLRFETGALGEANTLEFGSIAHEDQYRALRALSPYNNVRDRGAYPAVLLETGANDPRVPSWQLAKMSARLQAASSSGKPVLLRVDYDAGHGLGSNRDQVAALLADEFAFLAEQLGLPSNP